MTSPLRKSETHCTWMLLNKPIKALGVEPFENSSAPGVRFSQLCRRLDSVSGAEQQKAAEELLELVNRYDASVAALAEFAQIRPQRPRQFHADDVHECGWYWELWPDGSRGMVYVGVAGDYANLKSGAKYVGPVTPGESHPPEYDPTDWAQNENPNAVYWEKQKKVKP